MASVPRTLLALALLPWVLVAAAVGIEAVVLHGPSKSLIGALTMFPGFFAALLLSELVVVEWRRNG